ncbi:NAD(P)/FAD-dependent oxidoreductase [Pantoea sp. BAV 3049]|uniref:NAD(P)/FAD-dependent oxidoreductase n=1 Tax=Pantoea sp. BAV 3049 TaxID=2654188 RepID=UPI00131AC7D1|nr:NAD(P)/FAD-dependent oxidoreductase [Pantoea sp. BAV 3049]
MSKNILIVGSGFAGMWAAISAARLADLHQDKEVTVTVLAPQPELRVRPRFYENNAASFVSPLSLLFAELGIKFIKGSAERIDANEKIVWYRDDRNTSTVAAYDKLILATGSHTQHAPVAGLKEHAFDIDQLESAQIFDQHLASLPLKPSSEARNTVVICGGGFTGIELATELPSRLQPLLGKHTKTKIIVVDRGPVIGGRYSEELRKVIAQASEELGVEWRLNTEIEAVDNTGVTLKDGSHIPALTVVWTAGVQANKLGAQLTAERDGQGRLMVNDDLQVPGCPDIYATGDMAHARTDEAGNKALMTCQHAIQLGKFAGNNAAASVMNVAPLPYRQLNYVTCLDLGAWGAVYTEGWAQQVKSVREEAKKIKIAITNELIYPPAADRQVAFAAADPLAKFV